MQGKSVLITGGGSGIGAAAAALFAKHGASVMITGIREAPLQEVAAVIESNGGRIIFSQQDVALEKDWEIVTGKMMAAFGKIDVLVNNAGVTGDLLVPLEKRTVAEFMEVIGVNLLGPFLGIRTVAPLMKPGSAIVNVSSIAGITGNAGGNAYTASKGGSRMLSKGAAIELAKSGIRVNSIHPGYVETPMVINMSGAADFRNMAIGSTPMGRGASPEELANGILFLASDASSYMTGAELIMDGGFTAF